MEEDADGRPVPKLCGTRAQKLAGELEKNGMERLYRRSSFPCAGCFLPHWKTWGICIDREQLRQFGDMRFPADFRLRNADLLYSGGEFNINPTRQLGELLFGKNWDFPR